MKFFCAFLIVAGVLAGCDKDNLTTKPTIKFKNNNYLKDMRLNELSKIELEVTDKEGDLADTFYIYKKTLNRARPERLKLNDLALPEFPATQKVDILVQFFNNRIVPAGSSAIGVGGTGPGPDTCVFTFSIVDKKGNMSDSITTEQFILRLN
jgi:hypothetical protein